MPELGRGSGGINRVQGIPRKMARGSETGSDLTNMAVTDHETV